MDTNHKETARMKFRQPNTKYASRRLDNTLSEGQ